MNIYYNKYKSDDNIENKKIDNIIDDINNKKYIFYVDNNYNIFKQFSTFYCTYCDNLSVLHSLCHKHYDKQKIIDIINHNRDIFINEVNENYKDIKKNHNKYRKLYVDNMIILNTAKQICEKNLFKYYNFKIQLQCSKQNLQYIGKNMINYNAINTKFNKDIEQKIQNYIKNTDTAKIERKINVYIIINFLQKKFLIYQTHLSNTIYNIRKNTYNPTYHKIPNNYILYDRIINSYFINFIDYIDTETTIILSNHALRFDIFLVLCIDNIHFHMIIETDESHHLTDDIKIRKYDYYKDKYAVKNGTSMIRININKTITENDINFALFCIGYVIETKKPLYHFNENYVDNIILNHINYDDFSDNDSDSDSDNDIDKNDIINNNISCDNIYNKNYKSSHNFKHNDINITFGKIKYP